MISHKLKCSHLSFTRPTPSITWNKTEGPPLGQNREDSFGLALVFDNVDFDDRGVYQCIAVGNGVMEILTTNVTVKCNYHPLP